MKKDLSRGTYAAVLRAKAAVIGAVALNPTKTEICEDVPDTSYLAVRNAKRLAQFRDRLQHHGTNIVNVSGKIEVRGKNPDLYIA
jgi:hypothetical protein